MLAPALMIQGTASSVGKSLLVTALCRLFKREGIDVVPFKSQNMALNSAVTRDGLEIGRAQAVQAEAAGLSPTVEMNPILLKPEGASRCQVVVMGRPAFSLAARQYHEKKPELAATVAACLESLRRRHQLVLIEGAGSPAEVNLKDRDIVNMHVARLADAPVLLAGDIDRGGVLAAFVGTLELLEPDERDRVAAFVINKFRGDKSLLDPALEFLERRTGKPVLGVVPYLHGLRIADEDSLALDHKRRQRPEGQDLDIVVIRLPHISNFDDFTPLEHEAGVTVRFAQEPDELRGADLVILPGSKTTIADLAWLDASGLGTTVRERAASGDLVLGICGGCQMLGSSIEDPEGVESAEGSARGLGLLDLSTRFRREKVTAQVKARAARPSFLMSTAGVEVSAYEIHMGEVTRSEGARPVFQITSRNGQPAGAIDGAMNGEGNVLGTLLHGLFENPELRASLIAMLSARRGGAPASPIRPRSTEDDYDRLADAVRDALDLPLLYRLARLRV